MDASPGHCVLARYGSTIREVLRHDGFDFDPERISDLKMLVFARIKQLEDDEYVSDPIKVFVKQEPHKAEKLTKEKYRLISAVSLIDTMIDRILGRSFMEGFVDNALDIPSAVGWDPVRGGHRHLRSRFPKGVKYLTADKSSWDWTVQKWMITASFEVINDLSYTEDKSLYKRWYDLLWKRVEILFNRPFFKFQDGTVVQQRLPGIMKSGCYWTISVNTLCQSLLHRAAGGVGDLIALGDDTLQEVELDIPAYLERLMDFGCIVKEHRVTASFEFGGFNYGGPVPDPVYKAKHKFQLMHAEIGEFEIWESYLRNYSGNDEWFSALSKIVKRITRKPTRSRNHYLQIWNEE